MNMDMQGSQSKPHGSKPHGSGGRRLIPAVVTLTLAVATLLIWQALVAHDEAAVHRITVRETEGTRAELVARLDERIAAVERMADRWGRRQPDEVEWRRDASLYVEQFPGLLAVEWVDPSGRVRWSVSRSTQYRTAPQMSDGRQQTIEAAARHGRAIVSRPLELAGDAGFLLTALVTDAEDRQGYVIAVFSFDALFDDLLAGRQTLNDAIELFDGDRRLYSLGKDISSTGDSGYETTLTFANAAWRLCVQPGVESRSALLANLPAAVLALGLLSAFGVGLTVHLTMLARARAAAIEAANSELRRHALDLESEVARRQEAETMARETEDRLRRVVVHAPFPIIVHAEDGSILHVSEAIEALTGYSHEDMPTIDDWTRKAYSENQSRVKGRIESLYAIDAPVKEGEFEVATKSGATRVWDFQSSPLGRLPDGRRLVVSMAADVTARKQAEAELKRQERLLRSILDAIEEGVMVADTEGNFLLANASARRLTAVGATDAPPANWPDVFGVYLPDTITPCPSHDLPLVKAMRGETVRGVDLYLHHDRMPQGLFVNCSAVPLIDEAGNTVTGVVVFRDVTAQRLHRDALARSEERFELAVRGSTDGLWDWDLQSDKVWYSPRFKELLGYADDEFPHEFHSFQSRLHPEDVGPTLAAIDDHLKEGKPYDVEYRLRTRERGYRWFRARGDVSRDSDGRPVRMAGSIQDITDRKESQQLMEARNRDMETLLYVTSHDLREPLRAIENFSQMVVDRYAERLDEKGRDFLERVVRGAQRMDRLIEDVLLLSRAQRAEDPLVSVEGSEIVREAIQNLQSRIEETAAVVKVDDELPRLNVQRRWAVQAVYNLLNNALKFTQPGEPPEVEIAGYCPYGPNDGEVGLVVRDRGLGVAPAHAERIFSLFQRAVGREIDGTGAGLAIVRQIAERHGGKAWCEPRAGGGSQFFVTFGGIPDEAKAHETAPDRRHLVG